MAEWIDKLGNHLVDSNPNKLRLTVDRHWEIKSNEKWVILPDHYVSGFILIMLGLQGTNTNNTIATAIFGA